MRISEMSQSELELLLSYCHKTENDLNKRRGQLDKKLVSFSKQTKHILKEKERIAKSVSKNMKFRNILIEKIHGLKTHSAKIK
jgi:hypothetical protein